MTRNEFLRWLAVLGTAQATGLWACESRPDKKAAKKQSRSKVLVIGAGIAGIAAARDLKAAGHEVIVLEARQRIGGRIWTDHSLGIPIDMGASWIHGSRGNPLTQLAQQHQIKTVASRNSSLYMYDRYFQPMSDTDLRQKREMSYWFLRRAYKLAYKQTHDTPVTLMLEHLIKAKELEQDDVDFLQWRLRASALSEGTSLDNLSTWYDTSKRFGGQQLLFPQGYSQLVERLAQGLTIKTCQVVHRIDWSNKMVKVWTKNNQIHEADFAVLTVPLGVLKKQHIAFDPPLPAFKQKAINDLGVGLLNKIILKFDDFFPSVQY
ncbi:FAD-dependent oxidoreductase [uncultured Microscilla sp.]|uniref:FAD-dependent oxidoreductase n=1 Tax=uncultured Microscilla sp. TaxID=432653 RepID=UPI00262840D1|nr:FAD-dependent oxidoreductase [uncultured Microscilla sp.]